MRYRFGSWSHAYVDLGLIHLLEDVGYATPGMAVRAIDRPHVKGIVKGFDNWQPEIVRVSDGPYSRTRPYIIEELELDPEVYNGQAYIISLTLTNRYGTYTTESVEYRNDVRMTVYQRHREALDAWNLDRTNDALKDLKYHWNTVIGAAEGWALRTNGRDIPPDIWAEVLGVLGFRV